MFGPEINPIGAHRFSGPDVQVRDVLQRLGPLDRQRRNDFGCGPHQHLLRGGIGGRRHDQIAMFGANPLGVTVYRCRKQEEFLGADIEALLVNTAFTQQDSLPAGQQRGDDSAPLLQRHTVHSVQPSRGYGEPMSDDILQVQTQDRIRTLTLNRPQARNALSGALREAIFSALADADADADVDVLILTGADPVFCAGLDLKEFGESTGLTDISPQWPPMTKPVIGAINGAAVTGGLELALYCDVLIASEQARFADTHARVGLLPSWGLSVRLPQKVGVGLARRMSLTGDYLSAADALRAGLVTEVVPHAELLTAARRVAASIVGNNQAAVRALLASYHRIDESQTATGLWLEAMAAKQWLNTVTGADVAANRAAVLERGRAQVQ